MRMVAIVALAAGLAQGAFVAPAEGPVPFRRDKLPIEVDTMTQLSRALVVLAGNLDGEAAEGRRTVAQMAALALALDPANRRARLLVQGWQEQRPPSKPEAGEVETARSRAWNVLAWLEQPEAGTEGQALGACLGDVLAFSDPTHPGAKERGAERGLWGSWVAPPDAFRDGSAAAEIVPEPEPTTDGAALLLKSASVAVPLHYLDKKSGKVLFGLVELTLDGWVEEGGTNYSLMLPGEDSGKAAASAGERLFGLLESRHGKLPEGLRLRLKTPPEQSVAFRNEGSPLGGALAVLGDSLFVGKAPAAAVLAAVGEDGELQLPARLWDTLRSLCSVKDGGRVVMPAAAIEFLQPLLTLDKSEFFLNHQVLLAKDVAALCRLASGEPPPAVTQACEAFEAIRMARGTRTIGSFVTFPSTRQRLGQILAACPEHASASLLALRGTSKWPQRLERKFYAREIRLVIEPMGAALLGEARNLRPAALDELEEKIRLSLGEIEKLFRSVNDRDELYQPTLLTVKLLGGLADDIKRSGEFEFMRGERSLREAQASYNETIRRLTTAVGDADEYPLPPGGGDR